MVQISSTWWSRVDTSKTKLARDKLIHTMHTTTYKLQRKCVSPFLHTRQMEKQVSLKSLNRRPCNEEGVSLCCYWVLLTGLIKQIANIRRNAGGRQRLSLLTTQQFQGCCCCCWVSWQGGGGAMISPSLKGTNSRSTQLLLVVVVVTYVLLLLLPVAAVSHTALRVADNQTQHPIGVLGIVEGKLKWTHCSSDSSLSLSLSQILDSFLMSARFSRR